MWTLSHMRVLSVGDYWGWWKPQRSYHHTGPVSTFYALREALAIVGEEGLTAMWDRHLQVSGEWLRLGFWVGIRNGMLSQQTAGRHRRQHSSMYSTILVYYLVSKQPSKQTGCVCCRWH